MTGVAACARSLEKYVNILLSGGQILNLPPPIFIWQLHTVSARINESMMFDSLSHGGSQSVTGPYWSSVSHEQWGGNENGKIFSNVKSVLSVLDGRLQVWKIQKFKSKKERLSWRCYGYVQKEKQAWRKKVLRKCHLDRNRTETQQRETLLENNSYILLKKKNIKLKTHTFPFLMRVVPTPPVK